MRKWLLRRIPKSFRELLERSFKKTIYRGRARYCPVCNSHVRAFMPYGLNPRPDAQCTVCKLLERHRFVWLFLKEKTNLFDGQAKKMLHFAPEPELEKQFRTIPLLEYLSADLFNPDAMVKMDISKIEYPDESFDIVYCSHVLEHVEDDKKAIGEIFRVLKKNGYAVLMVPITVEKTFEDPSVTDPRDREKVFGQYDHLRVYGIDVVDRISQVGFNVKVVYISDILSAEQKKQCGLDHITENRMPIFFCQKA